MFKYQINQNGVASTEVADLVKKLNSIQSTVGTVTILQKLPLEYTGYGQKLESIKLDLQEASKHEKLDRRLDLAKEPLEEIEKIYGNDSPRLANKLLRLADLNVREHRLPEAEAIYKRVLSIQENGLGSQHPSLIKVLSPYASLLTATKRSSQSDQMIARRNSIITAQSK
jgi:hypothetical protein